MYRIVVIDYIVGNWVLKLTTT